jgi:HAMP domain-containing protein
MSIKKSIVVLIFCFSSTMGLGLYFFYNSISLSSGFTSFVALEHKWADGERLSAYHLNQFVHSANQSDFYNFLRAQRGSLSLRLVRNELAKDNPDYKLIEKTFVSAPEELIAVREVIQLLNSQGQQSSVKKAIEKWTQADKKLALLEDVASELRDDLLKPEFGPDKKEYYLARIDRLHTDFSVAEKEFGASLLNAQANFQSSAGLFGFLFFIFAITAGAVAAYFTTSRSLTNLKKLTEAVEKLRSGDYNLPIEATNDETRGLVSAFKVLSEDLKSFSADHERSQTIAGLGLWKWYGFEQKMFWSKKMYEFLNLPLDSETTYENFRGRIHPEDRAIFDNLLKKETYAGFKMLPVEIRIVVMGSEGWQVRNYNFLVEAQHKDARTVISATVQEVSETRHSPPKAS